jgi:hypothetical protein
MGVKMRLGTGLVFAGMIAAVAPLAQTAEAAIVTFSAGVEFSGATAPVGPPPWLTISFDDGGGTGSVVMTVSNSGLTASEYVSQLDFNLDPALNPANLSFGTFTTMDTFAVPLITKDANNLQADGSGKYDVEFGFSTSNADSGIHRFGAGESFSVTISGIGSLTANSFNFLSTGGGNGAYPFAAHVQAIGEEADGSGWVSVPEPASMVLLAAGPLAMLARKRRAMK